MNSAPTATRATWTNSICQLGAQGRPQAWIISLGLLCYAGLTSVFAVTLGRRLDTTWGRLARRCLLLHSAYVVLLAFVQANPKADAGAPTAEGVWHIYLARGAMIFIWLAMFSAASHFRLEGGREFYRRSLATIALGVLLAGLYIAGVADAIDGLIERVMLLSVVAWLVALSLRSPRVPAAAGSIRKAHRADLWRLLGSRRRSAG